MEDSLTASSVLIRYRIAGSGEPVLLLHGWGSSMDSFRQVFDDLATTFRVVALDFPGHGKSGTPPVGWNVSDYTSCLLSVMDQLDLARPSIVAHSFGGRVAIKLAAAHPGRVGRLVLVDAAGIPPPRSMRFRVKRSLVQAIKRIAPYLGPLGAALRQRVFALVQSKDYAAATGPMRDTFVKVISEDLTSFLPKVEAPTLLIWGDLDQDTPPVSGQTMKSLIPRSEFVLLKGAGHFSYIDQFNLFRLLLRKFMLTPVLPAMTFQANPSTPMLLLANILVLVSLALAAVLFSGRAKRYLHMLQLDSYSNARLLRWIAARPSQRLLDLPTQRALAVTSLCLLVMVIALRRDSHALLVVTLAAAMFAIVAALRAFASSAQDEAKKPLVMTGRAKRILAATCLVGLVVVVGIGSILVALGQFSVPSAVLLAVLVSAALLPIVATGSTLAANILLIPVQAAINRGYVVKARANLARINPTVVGITGSFGKTTTKYFLDALVRDSIPTLKTPQSFNTLLGVCRVLNETLRPGVKLFVAEMGAYRPGDIAELAELLHPSIGILTAIGPQHLERFGSIDAVERTKFELIQSLPTNGLAVFNLDDPRCLRLSKLTKQTVMGYGMDVSRGDVDVWAENVRVTPEGMSFDLGTKRWGQTTVQTPVLGGHNVLNILAATCVALHLGIPLDTLRRRMKTLEGAPHRLQLIKGNDGVVIIDDSYNSNPVGAAEALRVLGQFQSGKRILITPGMVELGETQEAENERFGELAAEMCDYVFLVAGASSEAIHQGLRAKAFPEERIRALSDLSGATAELATLVRAGDVVLFANDLPDLYEAKS